MARWPSQRPAGAHQHDPPHWPAADALDAGEQFHLPRTAAAAVMAHAGDDVAESDQRPVWKLTANADGSIAELGLCEIKSGTRARRNHDLLAAYVVIATPEENNRAVPFIKL
jgi:hypothetical protein